MNNIKVFSRQELYDLVWSEPIKTLAKKFGLSDVGLAKACKKANIPRPPRGHWAKLAANKTPRMQALPDRGPGMSDRVRIGGSRYNHNFDYRSESEILISTPVPPNFSKPIDKVKAEEKSRIKKVIVPKFPERAHSLIRKLLEKDEERRVKYLASPFKMSWDRPLFDEAIEIRRLKILSAIFTSLEIAGMKPSIHGKEAYDHSAQINDTLVTFTLKDTSIESDRHHIGSTQVLKKTNDLRLSIFRKGFNSTIRQSWEDTKGRNKLESQIREFVVNIIVAGEEQYREDCQWCYQRDVKRKENLIVEIRKRREDAERKERERQAAYEKERIDSLLSDADAMRKSNVIRQYIQDVLTLWEEGGVDVSLDDIKQWSSWAESQADHINPLKSGKFLESLWSENCRK